jgi:NAD(P)H-dependent FMN reductase
MCGSLGPASANQAALDVAVGHLESSGHIVVAVDQLAEVPNFRPQLVDDAGTVVDTLRASLESCDGLLLAVPEYAGGLAGVVKNALDWMVGSASLYHRPVGVLSAGTTGGVFALEQTIRTLSWQGALVVDSLSISAPRTKIDTDGRFVEPGTIAAIERWADTLIAAINAAPGVRRALVADVVTPYGIDPARFGELPPARVT